jgi:hypothetical protein
MPTWEFSAIPRPMVDAVRAEVPTLVHRVITAVGTESAVYGAVLDGPEGFGIRLGIEQAVVAFLDGAVRGEHPAAGTGELWRRLGESEFQAGRDLELLRRVFRTGARALWREAAHVAAGTEMSAELVVNLADAIFVYTDELASDVVEGYLRAQSDEAGELERRRRRVAALLLDPAGVDLEALSRAAALARWPLPRELAVLAVAGESAAAVTRRLDADVLVATDPDGVFVVVPDPSGPGRRGLLDRAAGEEECALGPVVGVRDTARSLRWARWLLGLAERGALPGDVAAGWGLSSVPSRPAGVLAADEHLVDLIVRRDGELADALVARRLGVIEALPDAERDRLEQTLSAWFAFQRHTPQVAEALHVHPQTVRYRISKLRQLLGEAMDEPESRFELELALRLRRQPGPRRGGQPPMSA